DLIVGAQNLEYATATTIARVPAMWTAAALRQARPLAGAEPALDAAQQPEVGGFFKPDGAIRARAAHKRLRDHAAERARYEMRMRPQRDQAFDRGGRVHRMRGSKNQSPGIRGTDDGVRGLRIAHFADHDYVRILAQHCANQRREINADFVMHLR